MEICLSAILGEMATRSINFLISKSFKPTPLDLEDRLHRVLLRAQVILDEAMGRSITNQAMLQQLDMLKDAMHRGYYMLDTLRYQSHNREDTEAKDQVVSQRLFLSKLTSLKGFCSSSSGAQILDQLQKALDDLSSMILDVEELAMFLMSYPRMHTQPYSMHLLLGNCMFGRHTEAELVINFLLHTQPHVPKEFEVLPIVGPGNVRKSTLVAYVCKDRRVRDHFSEILFLHDNDLTDDDGLATFREGCAIMKQQNCVPNLNQDRRLLVVVELVGDLSEDAWNRLYSSSKRHMPNGGKMIVTSRSDRIAKFGTAARALTLKYLSNEAYWYFFKTSAFGSMNPEAHPRLAHLAMEIARTLNCCLIGGNATASLLRENFDVHFWRKVLLFLKRTFQMHVNKFGEHPSRFLNQNRRACVGRMGRASEEVIIHHQYQLSPQEEVPKIRIQDVVYGSLKPHGKFEAIVWTSQIPPYRSFVYTCEISQDTKAASAKRKRS